MFLSTIGSMLEPSGEHAGKYLNIIGCACYDLDKRFDSDGTLSDPYVAFKVLNIRRRSATVFNTGDPAWASRGKTEGKQAREGRRRRPRTVPFF